MATNMFELLTDEQRAQVAMAVAAARAAAALKLCEGLNTEATLAVMAIALTTVVEKAYLPAERPLIIDNLLNDTLAKWAAEAAITDALSPAGTPGVQ